MLAIKLLCRWPRNVDPVRLYRAYRVDGEYVVFASQLVFGDPDLGDAAAGAAWPARLAKLIDEYLSGADLS